MSQRSAPSDRLPAHVVLAVVDLAGGGTQKVVAGLAGALIDAGVAVTLVTNRSADSRWSTIERDARLVELPGRVITDAPSGAPSLLRNLSWLIGSARRIRSIARASGPQAPMISFLPGTNVLVALASFGTGVPLVLSERNDVSRQVSSGPIRLARRVLYQTADVVTTNRANDITALQKSSGTARVMLVRNPPPRLLVRAEPSASHRIVAAGRLKRHKRHRDVVEAFSTLADDFPGWTLRILGEGPERHALQSRIAELGLQDRIELPGWSDDIGAELGQGALFVHSSAYEGTSNAVLEAMTVGLPCITSDTSSPAPAGETTTYRCGDIASLVDALRPLMSSGTLRDQRGREARRHVERLTGAPLEEWTPVIREAVQRSSPET